MAIFNETRAYTSRKHVLEQIDQKHFKGFTLILPFLI